MRNEKKRCALLICLALVLALIPLGCSSGQDRAMGAALAAEDLMFTVSQQSFTVREDVAPLLAALGPEESVSTSPSLLFEGEDKVYTYPGVTLCTYPDGAVDRIDEIILTDDRYRTARNARVGDSRQRILELYGTPASEEDSLLLYSAGTADGSPKLYFDFGEGDAVVSIHLYSAIGE